MEKCFICEALLSPVCEDKVHPDLLATVYSLDICFRVSLCSYTLVHTLLCYVCARACQ